MQAIIKLEFDGKTTAIDDHGRECQIDYVLAYEEEDSTSCSENTDSKTSKKVEKMDEDEDITKRHERRRVFEYNLQRMGLKLIYRTARPEVGRTRYVLVHAPFPLLQKQAQLLNVKLPVKPVDHALQKGGRALVPGCIDKCLDRVSFLDFDDRTKFLIEEPDYFTEPYRVDREKRVPMLSFVNWDNRDFLFPSAERSRLVYDLLIRARYHDLQEGESNGDDVHYRIGIERLLASSTYTGAYPLHQECRALADINEDNLTQRELLYKQWATWRAWYKYQPLDLIRRYFGTKIGLYFAWLGYYTKTLYPTALLGILAVLFGLFEYTSDPVSKSICDKNGAGGRIITCPACDHYCDFQYLNSSCVYSKVSYLFDNTMTVVFSALMSVWASLFLEGWKRYHAEVAWKWGLSDYAVEEDTVRPEFQYRVRTTKYNPVTKRDEPYLSKWKRLINLFASGATVLFFVILVLGVVFGIMVYRVICLQLLARADSPTLDTYAFLIVTITGAVINLIVILIMNYVYYVIALVLTRWECPRTQTDFDNSFTVKVFLFQFVNYYSSLFYIAFFKGIIAQTPGTRTGGGGMKISGARLEGCDAAGCFAELVIQLAIIMCGRQFFSAFMELIYPYIMMLIRRWMYLLPKTQSSEKAKNKEMRKKAGKTRWEADYFLSPTYEQWLFDEYLEMVIQFGFITLFVAAFPLAPLFALLNNIMEIRLDAYKFLMTTQRPIPSQSRNIGIWLQILEFLSYFAVTINAMVIAFTSDFVPKFYYMRTYDWNLENYVEWSLSYFDSRDIYPKNSAFPSIPVCRYRGFRNTPCGILNWTHADELWGRNETCEQAEEYGYSSDWWKIFALRLAFVFIFEHVVFLVKTIVDYLISDTPTRIFMAQQREKFLQREAVISAIDSRDSSFRDRQQKKRARWLTDMGFSPESSKSNSRLHPEGKTPMPVLPESFILPKGEEEEDEEDYGIPLACRFLIISLSGLHALFADGKKQPAAGLKDTRDTGFQPGDFNPDWEKGERTDDIQMKSLNSMGGAASLESFQSAFSDVV